MNSMFLSNALGEIRDDYLYDAMGSAESGAESRQGNKRRFLSAAWQKALAVAACLAILVGVCAVTDVFHLRGYSPGAEHPQNPIYDYPQTRIYSDPTGSVIASTPKPMPPQRIKADTFSYYRIGDTVTVNMCMGDEYTYRQAFGRTPNYDTYGVNGYPVLLVYDTDEQDPGHYAFGSYRGIKEDSRLIVNGEENLVYEKRFSREDMASLDISVQDGDGHWSQADQEQYHPETVTLDFSRLAPGDYGSVALLFGWYFEHDNPCVQDKDTPSVAGYAIYLGYFVGQEGVGLSFNGWEDAINALQEDKRPYKAMVDAMSDAGCSIEDLDPSNDEGYIPPIHEAEYGSFSGCRVWFVPGQLCVVTEKTVAGYPFTYCSSFMIYVEKDGVDYDLSQAYEDGLLTEQDVAEIWQTHRAYVEEGRLPGVG